MISSENQSLDCLAIGAHPDDAELFAGGTLALAARRGRRVGILDLTRGEAATRGTPEQRAADAKAAAEILGLALRETLDLGDGDLADNQANRAALVEAIRRLRPRLILTHHPDDRHPDHPRAHALVRAAAFFANVANFPAACARWRVEALAFFPGNTFQPDPRADWVVDVSETFETKLAALRAYKSQFHSRQNPESPTPGKQSEADPAATYIASPEYWEQIERRARAWGHRIGATHAEPFLLDRPAHTRHPLVKLIGD